MTVWQLFNLLTAFATHTPTWTPHDLRRPQLMEQSVSLLNHKRNIIEYHNVFGCERNYAAKLKILKELIAPFWSGLQRWRGMRE